MWYHFVNWRSERPYICPRDAATATTRVSCGVREIPEAVRRISKFICLTLFLIATAEVGASATATDIIYYKGAQVGDSKDYGLTNEGEDDALIGSNDSTVLSKNADVQISGQAIEDYEGHATGIKYIIGGVGNSGSYDPVTGNKLSVIDETTLQDGIKLYGGYSAGTGTVGGSTDGYGNSVTIGSNAKINIGKEDTEIQLYGGFSNITSTASLIGNSVTFDGTIENKYVRENIITVAGGWIENDNNNGEVKKNKVIFDGNIDETEWVKGVTMYGGYSAGTGIVGGSTDGDGNTLTINGKIGSVNAYLYGGYSAGYNSTNNKVVLGKECRLSSESTYIYGGKALQESSNNKIELQGKVGAANLYLYAGYSSSSGSVQNNTLIINKEKTSEEVALIEVSARSKLYGGFSEASSLANVIENTVEVQENNIIKCTYGEGTDHLIAGGWIENDNNNGEVKKNKVKFDGNIGEEIGWVNNVTMYGGYSAGTGIVGGSTDGDGNSVTIGSNAQINIGDGAVNLYGGFSNATSHANVIGNSVTLNGTIENKYVHDNGKKDDNNECVKEPAVAGIITVAGGWIENNNNNGEVNNNKVNFDGNICGSEKVKSVTMYGGYSAGSGEVNDNELTIGGTIAAETIALYGGYVFSGNSEGNTLIIDNAVLANVSAIGGVQKYEFYLTKLSSLANNVVITMKEDDGATLAKIDNATSITVKYLVPAIDEGTPENNAAGYYRIEGTKKITLISKVDGSSSAPTVPTFCEVTQDGNVQESPKCPPMLSIEDNALVVTGLPNVEYIPPPSLETDSQNGSGETGSQNGSGETGSQNGSDETGSQNGSGETDSQSESSETGSQNGSGETGSQNGSGETGSQNGSGETGSQSESSETDLQNGSGGLDPSEANANREYFLQTKTFSEARVASLAAVQQSDNIIHHCLNNVMQLASGGTTRLILCGESEASSSCIRSGSHVNTRGFSAIIGAGLPCNSGNACVGAFSEFGCNTYESYNEGPNENEIKGNGSSNYVGCGVMWSLNTGKFDSEQFYFDGAGRIGIAKFNYGSSDIVDDTSNGALTTYDASASYHGISVGCGCISTFDSFSLNTYCRYLWVQQSGNKTILSSGKCLRIRSSSSRRSVVGLTALYKANEKFKIYLDTSYQHEFDGKINAQIDDRDIGAPSLHGNIVKSEAGISIINNNLSISMGMSVSTGASRGITGKLLLQLSI